MRYIIACIVFILGILCYIYFTNFTPLTVIVNDSYAIASKKLEANLFNDKIDTKNADIENIEVSASDSLYKGPFGLYVGDEKKINISGDYPLYTNNNLAIINLSSGSKLIDDEFKIYLGYKNFTLTSGELYNNLDMNKADNNNYIFLETPNQLYINSKLITIKTELYNKDIQMNSIINFNEKEITYYSPSKNILKYNKIEDIDKNTKIIINNKEYNYNDFLIKMDIIVVNDTIDIENNNNNIDKPTNDDFEYVKPEVSVTNFIPNVYSASAELNIKDTAGVINSDIVFELKKDNKIYLRKAFNSSGNIEIVGLIPGATYELTGTYYYLDENKNVVEKRFTNQEFTTKKIDSLESIKLSFNNGSIYSDKIELKNLKIASGLNSETINGIRKVEVIINNEIYKMSATNINLLLSGESFTYLSPNKIKSNQFINYKIVIYDYYNNELKVSSNTGTTRTAKAIPVANVNVSNNDINAVSININLINIDNINISNYKYIVYNFENKIVSQGLVPENNIINLNNLNANELFTVSLYGDFDIEDGQGVKYNQNIGETKFTSMPISALGYIKLKLDVSNITDQSAGFKINIDNSATDSRLLDLLKELNVNIYKKIDNNKINVFTKKLNENEINLLKIEGSIAENLINLNSSTEYFIEIKSVIMQGEKEYNLDTIYDIKTFKTLKKTPQVLIKNQFINENMIDYDIKIVDDDNAIENNEVILEVKTMDGKTIDKKTINTNEDYVRIVYDKLLKNTTYVFSYIAEKYNIGHSDSTYLNNYKIQEYNLYTETGISGTLGLLNLIETTTGKNLYDISSTTNVEIRGASSYTRSVSISNNTVTLGTTNGWTNFSYYLPNYINKKLTISFYAKYVSGTASVYIANGSEGSTTYKLNNLNANDWTKYTYTMTLNSNGFLGININEISGNGATTKIILKDIQIEEGTSATTYVPYEATNNYNTELLINLNDSREEITSGEYKIKKYKNDQLIDTNTYSMNNSNIVTDKIITDYLDKNASYKFDLVVTVRDRDYVINTTTFTTEKEIRSIRTVADFLRINSNGKFLVLNDLDFTTGNYYLYYQFNGEIDFQGHTVKLSSKNGTSSYLFRQIGSTGVLKNINLEMYFNNTVEKSNFYGLNLYNYGKIENIIINIMEATQVPNISFSSVSYINSGTIQNFIVNSKVSFSAQRYSSPFVSFNYNLIKNGYVYGENINATWDNTTENKSIGSIAGYTSSTSQIKNVYSLLNVDTIISGTTNTQVGSMVGYSSAGLIENSYSIGEGLGYSLTRDPNVGSISTLSTNNLYYYSTLNYSTNYSKKVSNLALHNVEFQNETLNSDNKFIIDELINKGFYPQIKLPDCMPNQELLSLLPVENADLVDIISSKVLSNNNNTTSVLFNINNPAGEEITNISVKDVQTTIVDQQYFGDGKGTVTVNITNPVKYLSKYYVKSITSEGSYHIPYTRNYADNERVLYFDLYKEIDSIDDWKLIKDSPSENYKLVMDLNFEYASNFLVGNFSGKLDGNNRTIRNINITTGGCLFTTLSGKISNLFVENYNKINPSSYAGLVYEATSNSIIDNVHMKNVTVNGTLNMGGIIGLGTGITIKNSSVTNFSNNNASELTNLAIGSIAGKLTTSYIYNSFAQDININVSNAISTDGVGGLVGYMDRVIIENVYAVGNIKNNTNSTGGIVGYETSSSISNVYSKVNIDSKLDFIGGVIGKKASGNKTLNTLVLGSIYSSYPTSNMHRTVGNIELNQNNYAINSQLINGYISEEVYGEVLLSYNDLLSTDTYINIIKIGEYFNYDNIESGRLPKLYRQDSTGLLPNQISNNINTEQFSILSIDTIKTVDNATILFSIDNPNNYVIDSIEFDYFNITNINKNITDNGITTYEVVVTPNRYLDAYKLNKINYIKDGNLTSYNKTIKLDLQFYKELANFDDWQDISKDIPENYKLTEDIDFTNRLNVNTNVSIARLESTNGNHTLSNINLTFTKDNQALIKTITTSLKNVNFTNISITNNKTSGTTNGIIRTNFANIDNCNFTNININASKMAYSNIINFNYGYVISNITLDTINNVGLSYTTGFIGTSTSFTMTNIIANNITIVGRDYTAGVLGFKAYETYSYVSNINANNINVTSNGTYVGGIVGYSGINNSTITNSTILGSAYVGGIGGSSASATSSSNTVNNCHISGTNNYIGGVFGNGFYNIYDTFVIDSTIEGLNVNTNRIGGIAGAAAGSSIYSSGIINSNVISNGYSVGGILGYQNSTSIFGSYVYNTTVRGLNNVGGIIGHSLRGDTYVTVSNANVIATGNKAGGFVGYVENASTTAANNISRIFQSIVAGGSVTAQTHSGGLIGYVDVPLYNGHYYSNIINTTVISTGEAGEASPVIGSLNGTNYNINNLLAYEKMLVNNVTVDQMPNSGLTAANLVSAANLELKATYTSKGFSSTAYYWDYTVLSNKKFPLVRYNNVTTRNQVPIDLPSGTNPLGRMLLLSYGPIHILPTFDIYTVDVDKVNIEFNNIDEYTTFKIKNDNNIIGEYNLDKKVYTFTYDFNKPIEIEVTDNINTESKFINPSDINRLAMVYENKYYYIKEGLIHTNNNEIDGKYVNIYNNKALSSDGNIYDLTNNEITNSNIKGLTLLDEVKPLFEFKYDDYTIETFNNYSIINKLDNMTIVEDSLIIKDGYLELIDHNLPMIKDSIILDNYSNNTYLTFVGKDNKLYNLKDIIKLPLDFINKDISYMTNNINNDNSIIVLAYKDGSFYGFDYRTGEKIFYDKVKRNITIFDYFKEKLNIDNKPLLSNNNAYQETKTLQSKLIEKPISNNIINNKNSNILEKTKYITKYDYTKGEFLIYKDDTILSSTNDKIAENNKIYTNPSLIKFYYGNKNNKFNNINGLTIVISVLIAIILSMIFFFKNIKIFSKLSLKKI
jgi:hypothetical protein